jgi:general secretion pathway protein L
MRDNHVRIAVLNARYRTMELEGLHEELLTSHETPADALRACLAQIPAGGFDSAVAAVDGARCFTHQVNLPESAKKRLAELLPFELEAVLPLDIDELLIDHAILGTTNVEGSNELKVLTVASRLEHVQEVIDLVRDAGGKQPERIGVSTTELAQLTALNPVLRGEEPIALVDLGFHRTDICILKEGAIQKVRALSLGIEGFPESANTCVARIRQTLSAHATSTGQEVSRIYVVGDGAAMNGLTDYLAGQLGVIVELLDKIEMEGLAPEIEARVPSFGRALATAMHAVRGKGFDLRQGELAFERGYEHVKERAPLLAGLVFAVLLSFFFSIWAESRALAAENEALVTSLEEITSSTFGTGTGDPDEAEISLEKARKSRPEDPMPYLDGFGVAVALSDAVPADLVHDVEELDIAKGRVKIRGLVESAKDAQTVAKKLGKHRCIHEPSVTKITQVVNTERERYTLEAELYCPEDEGADKKSKKSGGSK